MELKIPAQMQETLILHASCIVLGEAGILIQGKSGSGKSTLARGLLEKAHQQGLLAKLVGDDRIIVQMQHGRILARPHPCIQGLLEIRGFGLIQHSFEPYCVIKAGILCQEQRPSRLPDRNEREMKVAGVTLPRLFWKPSDGLDTIFMCLKSDYLTHIVTE
jgi:HPr kinase/phosphorylase